MALIRVLISIVPGALIVAVTISGGVAGARLVVLRRLAVVVLRRLAVVVLRSLPVVVLRRLRAGRWIAGLRLPSRACARLVYLRATRP